MMDEDDALSGAFGIPYSTSPSPEEDPEDSALRTALGEAYKAPAGAFSSGTRSPGDVKSRFLSSTGELLAYPSEVVQKGLGKVGKAVADVQSGKDMRTQAWYDSSGPTEAFQATQAIEKEKPALPAAQAASAYMVPERKTAGQKFSAGLVEGTMTTGTDPMIFLPVHYLSRLKGGSRLVKLFSAAMLGNLGVEGTLIVRDLTNEIKTKGEASEETLYRLGALLPQAVLLGGAVATGLLNRAKMRRPIETSIDPQGVPEAAPFTELDPNTRSVAWDTLRAAVDVAQEKGTMRFTPLEGTGLSIPEWRQLVDNPTSLSGRKIEALTKAMKQMWDQTGRPLFPKGPTVAADYGDAYLDHSEGPDGSSTFRYRAGEKAPPAVVSTVDDMNGALDGVKMRDLFSEPPPEAAPYQGNTAGTPGSPAGVIGGAVPKRPATPSFGIITEARVAKARRAIFSYAYDAILKIETESPGGRETLQRIRDMCASTVDERELRSSNYVQKFSDAAELIPVDDKANLGFKMESRGPKTPGVNKMAELREEVWDDGQHIDAIVQQMRERGIDRIEDFYPHTEPVPRTAAERSARKVDTVKKIAAELYASDPVKYPTMTEAMMAANRQMNVSARLSKDMFFAQFERERAGTMDESKIVYGAQAFYDYLLRSARYMAEQKHLGPNREFLHRELDKIVNPEARKTAETLVKMSVDGPDYSDFHRKSVAVEAALTTPAVMMSFPMQFGQVAAIVAFSPRKWRASTELLRLAVNRAYRARQYRKTAPARYPSIQSDIDDPAGLGWRSWFIHSADELLRVAAGEMGDQALGDAVKGDVASRRTLERVGYVDAAQRLLPGENPFAPRPENAQTARDLATKFFSDYTQGRVDPAHTNAWISTDAGQRFLRLSKFALATGRVTNGVVAHGRETNDWKPMARLMVTSLIAGELVGDVRAFMRGYGINLVGDAETDGTTLEDLGRNPWKYFKRMTSAQRIGLDLKHPTTFVARAVQGTLLTGVFGVHEMLLDRASQGDTLALLGFGPGQASEAGKGLADFWTAATEGLGGDKQKAMKALRSGASRELRVFAGPPGAMFAAEHLGEGPNPNPNWFSHASDVILGKATLSEALARVVFGGKASGIAPYTPERAAERTRRAAREDAAYDSAELKQIDQVLEYKQSDAEGGGSVNTLSYKAQDRRMIDDKRVELRKRLVEIVNHPATAKVQLSLLLQEAQRSWTEMRPKLQYRKPTGTPFPVTNLLTSDLIPRIAYLSRIGRLPPVGVYVPGPGLTDADLGSLHAAQPSGGSDEDAALAAVLGVQ